MNTRRSGHLGAFAAILVFATIPLAIGCGLLYLRHATLRDTEAAKSWIATPCVIEQCEFTSGSSDSGPSLEIVYRYEVDGKDYKNDRLDLLTGSMGDDDIMEKRVHESFPPGANATCYVDPNDPQNSVFDRDHAAGATDRLWMLSFPFVCTGLGFWLLLIRGYIEVRSDARKKREADSVAHNHLDDTPPRRIPWHSSLAILSGPRGSQLAWLFVVAFGFVFILLDGPACYARFFQLRGSNLEVEGRVTDVRKLEGHEFGSSVYQNLFEYEVDGQAYTGDSYTRGKRYSTGDAIPISYHPDHPGEGYLYGARPSEFSWWHSAIPLGVLLLLGFGLVSMYVHNFRAWRVLRCGVVTTGRRLQAQAADEHASGPEGTRLSPYYFELAQGYVQAKWYAQPDLEKRGKTAKRSPRPESVKVIYNLHNPGHNVILGDWLLEVVSGRRTWLDNLAHSYAAPCALLAIALLLQHAP